MATLDRVVQMQQEGKSDTEVMAQLQQEGTSPSEINDAINQAKVKNAVSPPEPPAPPLPAAAEAQPPAMPSPNVQDTQQATAPAPPQAPEAPQAQQEYAPQAQQEYAPQPQDNYYTPQPQAYSEQDYYPQQEGTGTETISEIAEQVATEKLEDYKSKVGDVAAFQSQIQNKVNDIDDRLKRIENSIDHLQQAILGKIGEFGESSAMIHKDLDNLHGTVSKLMNPLIDNVNEMKKHKK